VLIYTCFNFVKGFNTFDCVQVKCIIMELASQSLSHRVERSSQFQCPSQAVFQLLLELFQGYCVYYSIKQCISLKYEFMLMVVNPVFVLTVPLDSVLMVPFLRFGVIWSKFNLSKPWSLSSFKFHFVSWLHAPISLYCSQLLPPPSFWAPVPSGQLWDRDTSPGVRRPGF